MPMRCHLACALAGLVLLGAGLLAIDALARAAGGPGQVWVLAAGKTFLAELPAGGGLRVLAAWDGGRVLRLHADDLGEPLPTRFALRLPTAWLALPACG